MIHLEAKLPDRPGSLIELIEPISKNGANIHGILHRHDKKVNDMIPVHVSFELNKDVREHSLKKIEEELKRKNIQIENLTLAAESNNLIVILTGHVFDTDIFDTIKRLASSNIEVSELQAKFTDLQNVSNVKLKIEFPDSITKSELISELDNICKEKNLFLISS